MAEETKSVPLWNHLFQSVLCATFLAGALLLLESAAANLVIVASLGSSAFVVFAMAESRSAGWRRIVVTYLFAAAAGTAMYGLMLAVWPDSDYSRAVFGALAVGCSAFFMTKTHLAHAPAAGAALACVYSRRLELVVPTIVTGSVLIAAAGLAARRWLHDLD